MHVGGCQVSVIVYSGVGTCLPGQSPPLLTRYVLLLRLLGISAVYSNDPGTAALGTEEAGLIRLLRLLLMKMPVKLMMILGMLFLLLLGILQLMLVRLMLLMVGIPMGMLVQIMLMVIILGIMMLGLLVLVLLGAYSPFDGKYGIPIWNLKRRIFDRNISPFK